MRVLVLILMIALLPLRALAGDVMATQMASSLSAIENGAARAHKTGATSTFTLQQDPVDIPKAMPDCHEQPASDHSAADGDADALGSHSQSATPSSDHCNTCAACQVCHTLALSPHAPGDVALFASPQLRQTSTAVFTSADAALGQKPPIS